MLARSRSHARAAAALGLALLSCAQSSPEVNQVLTLPVALPAPGVAPAAVEVRAEITAPDGARTVRRGFPLEEGLAVRVRPQRAGLHRYTITADWGAGRRTVSAGSFRAVDRGAPGPVRRRGDALVDGAGRPFHPLGENRFNVYDPEWTQGLAPEGYLARMARDGMNTLRIFVITGCGRPGTPARAGCLEPALGAFDPAVARQLDAVFAAGERHGVRIVLGLFAVGFTPGDEWKGWEENPYSAARGGPARTPAEFFTVPAARAAALRRLRYAQARWGASPALLAVDLLNEPEWDGGVDERAWIPWALDLARAWRAEDPGGTPITAGPVGLHWNVVTDERALWAAPETDVVQWHRYGPDVYEVHDLARALVDAVQDTRRYGRPVLLGEFAWGGEAKPLYDHTHVGLWAATFAGAGVLAHSAPPFDQDCDEPMTPARGRHFRVLADFLARAERGGPLSPAPAPEAAPSGLRALALARPGALALWLHAPRERYGEPVVGARVTASAAPGRWRVEWLDDATGAVLGREERPVGLDGRLALAPPAFTRHAAAFAERLGP